MNGELVFQIFLLVLAILLCIGATVTFRYQAKAGREAKELVDRKIRSAKMIETNVIAKDYFKKEDYDFFREWGPLLGVKHTIPKYREDAELYGVAYSGQLTRDEEAMREFEKAKEEIELAKKPPLEQPHVGPDYAILENARKALFKNKKVISSDGIHPRQSGSSDLWRRMDGGPWV